MLHIQRRIHNLGLRLGTITAAEGSTTNEHPKRKPPAPKRHHIMQPKLGCNREGGKTSDRQAKRKRGMTTRMQNETKRKRDTCREFTAETNTADNNAASAIVENAIFNIDVNMINLVSDEDSDTDATETSMPATPIIGGPYDSGEEETDTDTSRPSTPTKLNIGFYFGENEEADTDTSRPNTPASPIHSPTYSDDSDTTQIYRAPSIPMEHSDLWNDTSRPSIPAKLFIEELYYSDVAEADTDATTPTSPIHTPINSDDNDDDSDATEIYRAQSTPTERSDIRNDMEMKPNEDSSSFKQTCDMPAETQLTAQQLNDFWNTGEAPPEVYRARAQRRAQRAQYKPDARKRETRDQLRRRKRHRQWRRRLRQRRKHRRRQRHCHNRNNHYRGFKPHYKRGHRFSRLLHVDECEARDSSSTTSDSGSTTSNSASDADSDDNNLNITESVYSSLDISDLLGYMYPSTSKETNTAIFTTVPLNTISSDNHYKNKYNIIHEMVDITKHTWRYWGNIVKEYHPSHELHPNVNRVHPTILYEKTQASSTSVNVRQQRTQQQSWDDLKRTVTQWNWQQIVNTTSDTVKQQNIENAQEPQALQHTNHGANDWKHGEATARGPRWYAYLDLGGTFNIIGDRQWNVTETQAKRQNADKHSSKPMQTLNIATTTTTMHLRESASISRDRHDTTITTEATSTKDATTDERMERSEIQTADMQ